MRIARTLVIGSIAIGVVSVIGVVVATVIISSRLATQRRRARPESRERVGPSAGGPRHATHNRKPPVPRDGMRG
jgi:hypothetical protein